jgi:hypothetical protein
MRLHLLMSSIFTSVGTTAFSFCRPSLGPTYTSQASANAVLRTSTLLLPTSTMRTAAGREGARLASITSEAKARRKGPRRRRLQTPHESCDSMNLYAAHMKTSQTQRGALGPWFIDPSPSSCSRSFARGPNSSP